MAKAGTNRDFKAVHPDWVSQAQQNKYTDLELKVKQNVKKFQDIALARSRKLGGKD